MAIQMLNSVEFNKIPSLQFVVPVVVADPAGYEAGLIYNSTDNVLKYHDGTSWVTLGEAGSGGPPSGSAGGDLDGTYPNPQIRAGVIVDADVAAGANIAQSKISGLTTALAGKADDTTNLTAGNGLTGGGTLAANRTFDVGAGSGIAVAANSVAVDRATVDGWYEGSGSIAAHEAAADPHTGYQQESQKGAANGYAPLDANSLLPTVHLPPLAVSDTFVVASEAEMLALDAQRGDMAIRTDNGKTYVLASDSPGTLADWKEVQATGQVVSVNGNIGVVVLSAADVGAPPTSRTITAGNGLTGGGSLAANRTINVVGDANLSVTADQVSVLSAPKWTTARTLSLTGDVTGSTSIDGSGNASIATTVVGGSNLAKHYAGSVAAGTAVTVTHNLGSRDVTVEVYRNSAPYDTVLCDVERSSTNAVTLRFASSVAADAYRCVVTGR